jgi:sterol desaturase/sphingolipid hydroxylase (fatty acid hydroxylase superfamily)
MSAAGVEVAAPIPSPVNWAMHFLFMLVGCDCIFYWVHRSLHHPLLYKHIHKKHHKYTATNVWASEYFGVLDMLHGTRLLGSACLFFF